MQKVFIGFGYSDNNSRLHCNPYLIIEGDEAVLIDGGSRFDPQLINVLVENQEIFELLYKKMI